ncbi:antibiotic biosynthesis monooxygenase [Pelagibius litoralis]|uniref:Antibiotic biosynthesis monooxygenase n=1 Tax=Pelagibius litoralis TaxID=374515 RepID=A0A967C6U8_9PROT|nr:putative quinol monooxygenase [Pelagibius litoralis]NIA67432.1 antibiotic biosynthesis monooxygenase [Pelagibius litoralis]
MFVVTVIFEVQASAADAFRSAVLQQAENSLTREKACSRFDVCFDPQRPERVFLYEIYDDRAAFDEHLASDHFADFDRRVAPWVVDKTVNTWVQS